MAKVNIADFFSDTIRQDAKEQIEYLPLDCLDQDPNNFYSLDGLDDLAGNIELIGLQQPLRVRPGSDGRYIIVSGHRRRAAIMLIRDGGSHQFDDGVPCIVEHGEESAAMRELRLIYANASSRVMTSAEMSRQAERVEELLYRLKEEGREFPGRMRDHVAEACRISKSKLARLHAIRKNLAPDLLKIFDRGQINEATAYALSQQDQDVQRKLVGLYRARHPNDYDIGEARVKEYAKDTEATKKLRCRLSLGGTPCAHAQTKLDDAWKAGYRNFSFCFLGSVVECCLDCSKLASCKSNCALSKMQQEREKERIAAKFASDEEARKLANLREMEESKLKQEQAAEYWKRLGEALDRAEMSYNDLQERLIQDMKIEVHSWNCDILHDCLTDEDVEKLLAGEPAENEYAEIPHPFNYDNCVDGALIFGRMADLLDVSLDYLMLRTDIPKNVSGSDTSAEWKTGEPPKRGRYLATVDLGGGELHEHRFEWTGDRWLAFGGPLDPAFKVVAWYPLPDEMLEYQEAQDPERDKI